jgi:hypothetical protein
MNAKQKVIEDKLSVVEADLAQKKIDLAVV